MHLKLAEERRERGKLFGDEGRGGGGGGGGGDGGVASCPDLSM